MRELCIDMGTSNTVISSLGRDEVFSQPSAVTVDSEDNIIIDAGNMSKEALGKTPENLMIVKPLVGGVIADYSAAEGMLKLMVKKAFKRTVFTGVNAFVAVPSNTTQMERRAASDAVKNLGVSNVTVIEGPMAAAIGAGINVMTPTGNMVVDIGGGTAEAAVIALGNIATGICVKQAGDSMDGAIVAYVKRRFNVLIGDNTAEKIKIELGCAVSRKTNETKKYKGQDIFSGLPKEISITSDEIKDTIMDVLSGIVEAVVEALEKTPPELLSNIMESGITITGGVANLYGIADFFTMKTGFKTTVANNPSGCVLRGMEKVFTDKKLKSLRKIK